MIRSSDLPRLVGISYRQLDYWTRQGVLIPAQDANGSGTQRLWSEDEARIARMLGALRQLGARLRVLARVADVMRAWPENDWHGVVYIDATGHVSRLSCALCWQLDLGALALDLAAA